MRWDEVTVRIKFVARRLGSGLADDTYINQAREYRMVKQN